MCDGNSRGKDGNHIFNLSDDTKPHERKEPVLPDESQLGERTVKREQLRAYRAIQKNKAIV